LVKVFRKTRQNCSVASPASHSRNFTSSSLHGGGGQRVSDVFLRRADWPRGQQRRQRAGVRSQKRLTDV
jgi:hypothetical protein